MKKIIGRGIIFCGLIGMIACAIMSYIFMFQNPDMTSLRRFLEYPWPSVWCIIDYICVQVGVWMVKS